MSDRFYDFDKDDAFDEVYLKNASKRPHQKEFEVEIPMPKTNLKSTIPQNTTPKKRVKPARKKLSPQVLTLAIIGMVVSCILVFTGSVLAVIFGWKYIPSFEKEEKKSAVEDIEQIEEYVEISDDGAYVEVVPMYRETEGDDAPPKSQPSEDEDASRDDESENDENENDEDGNGEDTSVPGENDEIINID